MKDKELPGIKGENFNLKFDKNYIMGADFYDDNKDSFSIGVILKPKKVYKMVKVKGFKRVMQEGWSHIVEIIK